MESKSRLKREPETHWPLDTRSRELPKMLPFLEGFTFDPDLQEDVQASWTQMEYLLCTRVYQGGHSTIKSTTEPCFKKLPARQ